jgi:hypothetical protein
VLPSLSVYPEIASVLPEGTLRLFAQTFPPQQSTWSVLEAGGGTISADGTYTAPNQLGTFHILAQNPQYPQVQATATVNVVSSGIVVIPGGFQELDFLQDVASTPLADGRALITGGIIDCFGGDLTSDCTNFPFTILRSAQIYDSTTRSFSSTGDMINGRYGHTSTLLNDGRVLIVGGFDTYSLISSPVTTAEVFDPATGLFSLVGSPIVPRAYHTATLMADGTVLVSGGVNGVPDLSGGGSVPALATAEVYDPASDSFTPVADMSKPRFSHTSILLPNGKVLIAGGAQESVGLIGTNAEATAELYDPSAHTFSPAATMTVARFGHTATLLPSGEVLVAGGTIDGPSAPVFAGGNNTATVELYNPQTDAWSDAPAMNAERANHTATRLGDGRFLFEGGRVNGTTPEAEVYDPATGSSIVAASTRAWARWRHTATLMPDGTVLFVAGGTGFIEIYVP